MDPINFLEKKRLNDITVAIKFLYKVEAGLDTLSEDGKSKLGLGLKELFRTGEKGASVFHESLRTQALSLLIEIGATPIIEHIALTDGSGPLRGMAVSALAQTMGGSRLSLVEQQRARIQAAKPGF